VAEVEAAMHPANAGVVEAGDKPSEGVVPLHGGHPARALADGLGPRRGLELGDHATVAGQQAGMSVSS
jgi:hypothetical protein